MKADRALRRFSGEIGRVVIYSERHVPSSSGRSSVNQYSAGTRRLALDDRALHTRASKEQIRSTHQAHHANNKFSSTSALFKDGIARKSKLSRLFTPSNFAWRMRRSVARRSRSNSSSSVSPPLGSRAQDSRRPPWSPPRCRQTRIVLQIQPCRPLLDPAQQVLYRIEGDRGQPQRVVDSPRDFCQREGLQQSQRLHVLALSLLADLWSFDGSAQCMERLLSPQPSPRVRTEQVPAVPF